MTACSYTQNEGNSVVRSLQNSAECSIMCALYRAMMRCVCRDCSHGFVELQHRQHTPHHTIQHTDRASPNRQHSAACKITPSSYDCACLLPETGSLKGSCPVLLFTVCCLCTFPASYSTNPWQLLPVQMLSTSLQDSNLLTTSCLLQVLQVLLLLLLPLSVEVVRF